MDGFRSDEFQKHSNIAPSKHRVAAVWKNAHILNTVLKMRNGSGVWLVLQKCNKSQFSITSPWKGTAGTGWTLKMI